MEVSIEDQPPRHGGLGPCKSVPIWDISLACANCCRKPRSSAPTTSPISGCTCDSRQVRGGELFAALVGSRHDGHDFIAEAAARGCAAVLSERPVPEIGRALVRRAQRPRGLRPAVPNLGRQSQPPIEADRRDRHQRQDDHQLPDRRRADGGRLSRRRVGNLGISRRPNSSSRPRTPPRRPNGWRRCLARMVAQRVHATR